MSHSHHHKHPNNEKRLLIAALLTGLFMFAEIIGGLWSGSLALLADAGHMLTDVSSLLLAWIAAHISRRPADKLRSYGYHRVQILAAFINGIAFIAIVAWIMVEAVQRLFEPVAVMGIPMLVIALLGLVVNVIAFKILHSGSQGDLNVKAAMVHVLGDLLGSVAAITAAIVILWSGWSPIDPILSVLVALLVLRSAWYIVRHSAHILLEGVPDDIDVQQLRDTLISEIPQVLDVHHVHVWSLTPERPLLTTHVKVVASADYSQVLHHIKSILATNFGIHHSTVQVELEQCTDQI